MVWLLFTALLPLITTVVSIVPNNYGVSRVHNGIGYGNIQHYGYGGLNHHPYQVKLVPHFGYSGYGHGYGFVKPGYVIKTPFIPETIYQPTVSIHKPPVIKPKVIPYKRPINKVILPRRGYKGIDPLFIY